MLYLFFEIWVWLVAAFVLGWITHWIFNQAVTTKPAKAATKDSTTNVQLDNLQLIQGIGPKLEQTLRELGVNRFAQIAEWNEEDIKQVEERLSFKDRIHREAWVEQAKSLTKV